MFSKVGNFKNRFFFQKSRFSKIEFFKNRVFQKPRFSKIELFKNRDAWRVGKWFHILRNNDWMIWNDFFTTRISHRCYHQSFSIIRYHTEKNHKLSTKRQNKRVLWFTNSEFSIGSFDNFFWALKSEFFYRE